MYFSFRKARRKPQSNSPPEDFSLVSSRKMENEFSYQREKFFTRSLKFLKLLARNYGIFNVQCKRATTFQAIHLNFAN